MISDSTFSFSIADDLSFAIELGKSNFDSLNFSRYKNIGSIIEFSNYAFSQNDLRKRLHNLFCSQELHNLLSVIIGEKKCWISNHEYPVGVISIDHDFKAQSDNWVKFFYPMQQTIISSGFSKNTSYMLVGAVHELISNVFEHSAMITSGLISFRSLPNIFEFTVSDRGVGVLESLKSCIEYSRLNDHREALMVALTEGCSRYGSKSGRGMGFRQLFLGLANINGYLRFRTGDQALIIDGQTPTLHLATTSQKVVTKGLSISVSCHA